MTFNGKKILPLLLASILFLGVITFAKAQTDECAGKSGQPRIDCLSQKYNSLSSQANTLSNQITQFNYQITLTTLQIQQTEEKIAMLGGRIGQLEDSLSQLTTAFSSRAVETYKLSRFENNFMYILTASDISDAVSRFHYLQKIQEADRNLLEKLQVAQTTYKGQKASQEELQSELESQKQDLARQKQEKDALLTITRNDETRYATLLAQALAEQGAIKSAISSALELLKNGAGDPISAGDVVGLIGNSGAPHCSSGAHLHFTVLKDGSVQNPADYLKNISVVWGNQPDGVFGFSGSWDWPISSPEITQGFGMTYWARLGWYGGNIHDGIDMVSGDSSTIRAPAAGRIIRATTLCSGDNLKYAAIAHDGGVVTVYLHIQ